jgi:O-methyltransferase
MTSHDNPAAKVARAHYIDLLIRTISNTVYGDGSILPGLDPGYDAALREDGKDWPAAAHTMVGVKRLRNLADLTGRAIAEGIAGDFIETGVWRGGCCILMKGIIDVMGATQRRVFVADSFEGLPPPAPEAFPHDRGDVLHTYDELRVSEDQVRANFGRYGLLDERVMFVKGFFSDTLPGLDTGPLALMRLDGDMYESTIVALETLYPRLSPGGFVIIDDYGAIPTCKLAVTDFLAQQSREVTLNTVDWTGVWWQKPVD